MNVHYAKFQKSLIVEQFQGNYLKSKVVYKASCWDCDDFYIGKTKRRLHDRKTEHFKALSRNGKTSAIADHNTSTGHNIKWDHFEILATGRSDIHCRI